MLIEIHMIQNHSPANLNRDDLGAPKTCLFGGVTRARVSSQCIKRSIRRSPEFQQAMEKDGGIRTRRLITILSEKANGSSPAPDGLIEFVAKSFEKGGIKRDPTKDDPHATNILLFIPQSSLDKMAEAVSRGWKGKVKPENLCEELADLLAERATVPDIALCGRMTELDSNGLFRRVNFHVEAALSAAHAVSTHKALNEVDYFTAVDDYPVGTGAGHVNEAIFTSACFYKYFCIDWNQLIQNLGDNEDLAILTLRQFMYAATKSTPSGKQKSFAAFNLPDGVLVEVKTEQRVPVSYANAFADPVPLETTRGLVGESIAQLGQYVHEIADGYGLKSERFWFSPSARYPLTFIDRQAKEHEKEKPVVDGDRCFGALDDIIKHVVKNVGTHGKSRTTGVQL